MLLLDLHEDCIFEILSHVSLEDFPLAAVLCHRIHDIAFDNELWKRFMQRDFPEEIPATPSLSFIDWHKSYKDHRDYSWSSIPDEEDERTIGLELSDGDRVATVTEFGSGRIFFAKKPLSSDKVHRWKITILACGTGRFALLFGVVSERDENSPYFWYHCTGGDTGGTNVPSGGAVQLVAGDVVSLVLDPTERTISFDLERKFPDSEYPLVYRSVPLGKGGYIYACFNEPGSVRISRV